MRKECVLSVLLVVPSAAPAAELKDYVSLSLRNSPALKAAGAGLDAAKAGLDAQRRGLLPDFSGTVEEGYSVYDAAAGADLRDGVTGRAALEAAVDLKGIVAGTPRLGRLEADKAAAELELARRGITRDTAASYYRLYSLVQKRKDYAGADGYFASHLADIKALGERGLDVKLDLLRADVQRRALAADAADIDAAVASELAGLNGAAGAAFKLSDLPFSDIPSPAPPSAPPPAARATPSALALEGRLGSLEADAAAEALRQSAYAAVPGLTVGLGRALSPIDPATERWRAYAAVTVDIFGFGRRAAERRRLAAEAENRRQLALENTRRLDLEAGRLEAGLTAAAAACGEAARTLAAAEEGLDAAGEYYRQGKIKETDLLAVFSEYFSARERSRDALGAWLEKKAERDYLLGGEGL